MFTFQLATDIYKRLLLEFRDYAALSVYVAQCYYKLDYYDVSMDVLNLYDTRHDRPDLDLTFPTFLIDPTDPPFFPYPLPLRRLTRLDGCSQSEPPPESIPPSTLTLMNVHISLTCFKRYASIY